MKKVWIILCLLIFNCASVKQESNNKIKTFRNEDVVVKYPQTWFKFGGNGYAFFKPYGAKIREDNEDGNYLLVNKSSILLETSSDDIELLLYNHANTQKRHETDKEFKIIKLNSGTRFDYKIEYEINYYYHSKSYKREEYFSKIKNELRYISYQMTEDLFNVYHNEALFIINSVKYKN